jgi:hypothetical protein
MKPLIVAGSLLFSGTLMLMSSNLSVAQEPAIQSSTKSSISEEMIGKKYAPARLEDAAKDAKYGYSEKTPILVGGGFGKGSENTYRYLNALLGPNGEVVHYTRVGTCCSFKTKNSPFGGKGVLEIYEVHFEGGQAKRLFFNWYDPGKLMIPFGLTARK